MAKPPSLELPVAIADEIERAAERCERSSAFLAFGALKAASLDASMPTGPRRALALTLGEDDPRDLLTRLKKLAGKKSLDEAVALAWIARRGPILAWVEKVAVLNAGEQADDLDEGLRAAADPATPAAKLVELAHSEYPRVRALVAAHPSAPREALQLLEKDREPLVRKTLLARS